jgi:hypothetical protein
VEDQGEDAAHNDCYLITHGAGRASSTITATALIGSKRALGAANSRPCRPRSRCKLEAAPLEGNPGSRSTIDAVTAWSSRERAPVKSQTSQRVR